MTDKIDKFIKSLNPKFRLKLKQRLIKLKSDPFKGEDIKKLKGFKEKIYRLRIGKVRIIYKVVQKRIEIIDIDYRGNIY